jgi:hypothetical protein
MGPTFTLKTYDTGRVDRRGVTTIGYRLTRHEKGECKLLFEGADFNGSPMHAIDSDETMAALMGFLTLRPGDTDAEYFEKYTPEQLAWAQSEAEYLGFEAMCKLGEE